jgi:hypothetical protein
MEAAKILLDPSALNPNCVVTIFRWWRQDLERVRRPHRREIRDFVSALRDEIPCSLQDLPRVWTFAERHSVSQGKTIQIDFEHHGFVRSCPKQQATLELVGEADNCLTPLMQIQAANFEVLDNG